ncbi:transmembrane protein 218-like [Argonauta hians]
MALVFGVGIGILLLTFVWLISVSIFLFTYYAHGSISYIGKLLILLSTILTIVLLHIPRKPKDQPPSDESLPKEFMIDRPVPILVVSIISAVIGIVAFIVNHLMVPIHAKPMTKSHPL